MSTASITLPNITVRLTVEQLIAAARQLEPVEQTELARALIGAKMDVDLAWLITELEQKPPVEDISDADIVSEVRVVREQRP